MPPHKPCADGPQAPQTECKLKRHTMFSAKTYAARRNMLRTKIGSGIILLPGIASACGMTEPAQPPSTVQQTTTVAATIGVAELAFQMKNMIEFSPQYLYLIFFVMASAFVILTLPIGLLFTWLSNRLAVQR